ncbi:hypothetical protein CDIK_2704 [Cucumispora dikerogammari]|nr:hypothetical protein CDIK_2704 [Cucumispora dikerogammari]
MKIKETDIKLNDDENLSDDVNKVIASECERSEALTISNVPRFIQKDVGKLIPIEEQITRIEIKHLKHYIEHEEEYKLKQHEKIKPYVIFLNERISKIIEVKNKQEKERLIFYVLLGTSALVGTVIAIGTFTR